MKVEENKKQDELNNEQLDNVAGGLRFGTYYDPDDWHTIRRG